jgi:hypothetical protein
MSLAMKASRHPYTAVLEALVPIVDWEYGDARRHAFLKKYRVKSIMAQGFDRYVRSGCMDRKNGA